METQTKSIGDLVREAESDYIDGTTQTSKYVEWSLYENIEKIDAYLSSKHTSGEFDSMGREKPFMNIVTASRNIWYRATDLDRKNVKIRPTKSSDDMIVFIATAHLQEWMRRERFGVFLNDWGRTLASYGSAISKFVEKNGKLTPSVMAWNRMIVDPVDFDNNLKIEVLEYTEAQLRQHPGYDQEMVDKLVETKKARETAGLQNKDNRADFIKLYEVHGNLALSHLTGKPEDDNTYVDQMQVVSFVASKENGKFDDFVLFKGKEKRCPYMISHLIEEDGRTQGIGAVEHLFDAQWMVNHSVKSIKDQLDLASKLFFQTSDGNFLGQNAIESIETGDVMIHAPNEPLTQVNNGSHDITSQQNFASMWKVLGQEITSTPDSLMGSNQPSGTAWRQVEALQMEASSLFELMTENKGLAVEDMLREFVIPFLKKKMDTGEEIAATLKQYDIDKIDSRYVANKATELTNKLIVELALSDEMPTPEDQALLQEVAEKGIDATIKSQGNTRYFIPSEVEDKTWKEILKDLEWDVEVDITGEPRDTQNLMATLNTTLGIVAGLGGQPMPEEMKVIFNKILEMTGALSPIELSALPNKGITEQPQEPQLASPPVEPLQGNQ